MTINAYSTLFLLAFRIVERTKFITAIEMIRNDSRRQDATKAIECRKFSVAFPSLLFLLWIAVSSSPSGLRETTCCVLRHTLSEINSPPNNNLEE